MKIEIGQEVDACSHPWKARHFVGSGEVNFCISCGTNLITLQRDKGAN